MLKRIFCIVSLAASVIFTSQTFASGLPLEVVFQCEVFGEGDAGVDAICTNCPQEALHDKLLAVDGDLKTSAKVSLHNNGDLAGQASSITLIAKAQEGIIFGPGKRPGVLIKDPLGESARYTMLMTVLEGNTPRDVEAVVPLHTGSSDGATRFIGFSDAVSAAFDRISLTIGEIRPGDELHVYKLLEFCADGKFVPVE